MFCFSLLWCHRESNQGHKDFQSFALPTELWHQPFMSAFGEHCFPKASAKVITFFNLARDCCDFFIFLSPRWRNMWLVWNENRSERGRGTPILCPCGAPHPPRSHTLRARSLICGYSDCVCGKFGARSLICCCLGGKARILKKIPENLRSLGSLRPLKPLGTWTLYSVSGNDFVT